MKKVVLGLLFSSVLLVGCSTNEDASKLQETVDSLVKENSKLESENSELRQRIEYFETLPDETVPSEDENSQNSSGAFKYGESADFSSNERVTVTEVKADDSISLHEPIDGAHPVVVTATIENISNEPIDFNVQTFDLYDGDSELANFDASTYSNNIPDSIAGGKKATVVIHFASKGNAPYSVTYGPATWDE